MNKTTTQSDTAALFKRENPVSTTMEEPREYVILYKQKSYNFLATNRVFFRLSLDERIKQAKDQERESRRAALVRTLKILLHNILVALVLICVLIFVLQRTLNETKATAVQTNQDLVNQGGAYMQRFIYMVLISFSGCAERIKKMQDATAQIHDDMNVSEKFLRSIGSIWGALSNKFRDDNSNQHKSGRVEYEAQFTSSKMNENANNNTKTPVEKTKKPAKIDIDIKTFEFSMKEVDVPHDITDKDLKNEYDEFIRESDADLDEMLNGMKELKGIAYGMTDEIRDHNRRLSDLQGDVELANARIKAGTLKAKKLT